MKTIFVYLKHFTVVALIILSIGFAAIVSMGGHIGFGTDDLAFKVGGEGPHVFIEDNQLAALYVRGSREQGFYREKVELAEGEKQELPVYLAFDDSTFNIQVSPKLTTPPASYDDGQDIIAISDLEGNFAAFRDFLHANKVIDEQLNWTFNQGHLVLVGDIVDRGASTTQLLWLIYKLEQDAKRSGGKVHFIVGNHEIKNMQGNFRSAADKYLPISGILGKQQHELFGRNALLGKWLESKNVMERINGNVFVHGGLHPDIGQLNLGIEEINDLVRSQYRQFYYPSAGHSKAMTLLTSNKTGPAWYRGYFKEDLSLQQVKKSLDYFAAEAVVVGHTIQYKVNTLFDRKVFAIDVKHPSDYSSSIPVKRSEGLFISGNQYYRLLDDGSKIEL